MGEAETFDFKTYEEAAEWFDTHDMSDTALMGWESKRKDCGLPLEGMDERMIGWMEE